MTTPVLNQVSYRGRDDDVGLNSGTFTHALNTAFSQDVDTKFRVRFTVAETAGGMANNNSFALQFRIVGVTSFALIGAVGGSEAVQASLSDNFANDDPTTQVISTGSFIAGVGIEQVTSPTNITLTSQRTELEWCLLIDGLNVSNGQQIELRIIHSGGAVLDAYTATPTITVSEDLTGTGAGVLSASVASAIGSTPATGTGAAALQAAAASASGTAAAPPGPTPVEPVNTDASLTVDTTYLLRVRVENTGGAGGTDFRWSYNHDLGGTPTGWLPVDDTTSVHVRAVAATTFANDDDVPEVLGGSGTYLVDNNAGSEDGTTTLGAVFPASGAVEFVLAFQIVGAEVSDTQTGQIRLERGDGTDFTTYTNTLTYTVSAAAGEVSGTAAGTLQAAIGSATGESEFVATAVGTLAAVTGAADGTLSIDGVAAGNLVAASADASGSSIVEEITGTAAGDLLAATGDATGSFNAESVTGSGVGVLTAAVGSSDGSFELGEVTGTAAGDLAAAVGSATGSLVISGVGAGDLVSVTGSATGSFVEEGVAGTVVAVLDAATGDGDMWFLPIGQEFWSDQTPFSDDTGWLTVVLSGTGAATLDTPTGAATGWGEVTGVGAGILGQGTAAASGEVEVIGAAIGDLVAAVGDADGDLEISGTAAGDLAAATGEATGAFSADEVTGTATGVLAAVSGDVVAELTISGAAAGELDVAIAAATGPVEALGDAAGILQPASGSAVAEYALAGTAAGVLAGATGSAEAAFVPGEVTGTAAGDLAAAVGAADADLVIDGASAGALVAPTAEAEGAHIEGIAGSGVGLLTAATGSAEGQSEILGPAAGVLVAASGEAVGELTITGTAAGDLAAVSGAADAELEISGTADATLAVVSGAAEAALTIDGAAVAVLQPANADVAGELTISGTAAGTLAVAGAFVTGSFPTYVRLEANAVLAASNLQDTLANIPPTRIADIDEDVTADDGEWWTAVDPDLDTEARIGFPTPTSDPTGNQVLRVLVRSTAETSPTVRLELWENGVKRTSETTVQVTSTTGQIVTLNFDASELTDPTGAGAEIRIFGEAA